MITALAVAGAQPDLRSILVLSIAFLPLAATVYLVTSMAWTVAQTLALRQVFG